MHVILYPWNMNPATARAAARDQANATTTARPAGASRAAWKSTRTVADKLNPCRWCGQRNRTPSAWEQCNLAGTWQRLCVRCANRRLGNPWNALLPMRKIGSGD